MINGLKLVRGTLTVAGCVFLLCACSTARRVESPSQITQKSLAPAENAPAPRPVEFAWKTRPAGQVAPGYEIDLFNPTDEQMNGKFRIPFSGILELPYGIRVNTAGLSENSLKEKINSAYSNFYQTNPNLRISVVDKKFWIDVRGLVKKPGQYLVRSDSSLDEVIAQAEGLQEIPAQDPAPRYFRIEQMGASALIKVSDYYAGAYSGTELVNPRWQGGEVIFVQADPAAPQERSVNYVQTLGQVRAPGEYPYRPDADFYYYLVKAGGPTDRANLDKIEIVRWDGALRRSFFFSLEEPEDQNQLPAIQGGDLLIVHADNASALEKRTRIVSDIATIITGIATVIVLAIAL